jgi:hypothetical protein
MTSASRAVALRAGGSDQAYGAGRPAPHQLGRPAVVPADHGRPQAQRSAKYRGASSWKEGWTSTRAGDLGQQRVAWDPAFEPDPVGDAPATRGPPQAGTVRALAVAPQHGLPVAQVAQRPNRQLPPFQGSSR